MKKENIFWGILLILAGVFLVISKMGLIANINVFTILLSIFFVAMFFKGLWKKRFGSIFFSIAFLCILYDDILGITSITPWTVLLAAVLLTIGMELIFHNHHKKWNVVFNNNKNQYGSADAADNLSGQNIYMKNTFSGSSKYVNSEDFRNAVIVNSFGESNVYFDRAIIKNGRADISVSTSFGELNLYVPAHWRIIMEVNTAFGDTREKGRSMSTIDSPEVHINGSVSFGEMNVIYM